MIHIYTDLLNNVRLQLFFRYVTLIVCSLYVTYGDSRTLVLTFLTTMVYFLICKAYERLPNLIPLGTLSLPRRIFVQFGLALSLVVVFLLIALTNFNSYLMLALSINIVLIISFRPVVTYREVFDILRQIVQGASFRVQESDTFLFHWHSRGTRDIVANLASRGARNFEEIETALRMLAESNSSLIDKRNCLKHYDILWLKNLARLIALQPIRGEDLATALVIYKIIWDVNGPKSFKHHMAGISQQHPRVFLGLLMHFERYQDFDDVRVRLRPLARNHKVTDVDTLHPKKVGIETPGSDWKLKLNLAFSNSKFESIDFSKAGTNFFDSIECNPEMFQDGPLVTVIISTFNPGIELITSLKSVINQSWRNLEIILVDDCSENSDFVKKCAEVDPRIHLLRQSENRGTYCARNEALKIASGDFITTHDSDDWMHPRRVELHVLPLIEDKKIMATTSRAIRVTPEMVLSQVGHSPFRQNASSLTFRSSIVSNIGFFDDTRKAADSEYANRIRVQFPDSVKNLGYFSLSLIRMGHDSLSRNEFLPMWVHPSRQAYRSAYHYFHHQQIKKRNPIYVPYPHSPRQFAAPERFIGKPSVELSFDLIYSSNFSFKSGVFEREDRENIEQLLDSGLKVAILQQRPLQIDDNLAPWIQELINSGRVVRVLEDDHALAKLLIVSDVQPFQIKSPLIWSIKVEKSIFIARYTQAKFIDIIKHVGRGSKDNFLNPDFKFIDYEVAINNANEIGLNPKLQTIPNQEELGLPELNLIEEVSTWDIKSVIKELLDKHDPE